MTESIKRDHNSVGGFRAHLLKIEAFSAIFLDISSVILHESLVHSVVHKAGSVQPLCTDELRPV